MHLHLASHLGTLDEPREGRDDGIEPKDGVGGLFSKMEGPLEYMPEQEMLTKRVSSNKHQPSVGSQTSPREF